MKEPEYKKGTVVREEFERTMTALFRAPKPKDRKQLKATAERKTEKTRQTALQAIRGGTTPRSKR
jgi:hypothetical protein